MVKKGGNPSPVQVCEGLKGYNVWVYNNSETHPDGVIRPHYTPLTARGNYFRKCDASSVGWDYINSQNFSHCF